MALLLCKHFFYLWELIFPNTKLEPTQTQRDYLKCKGFEL